MLLGGYACIDHTDGAGMNLMDIKLRNWSRVAMEVTAPGLEEKLGKLAPAHAVAGPISSYFVDRFPIELQPGDLAISLGTSDTVFGIATDHKPSLVGHAFPNPVDTESYMVMLVYKNGSLTREGGKIGFYYKEHEILPPLPVGFHRYVLENFNSSLDGVEDHEVEEFDPPSEVRALIEGQLLSMRAHAERLGMPSPPNCIIATGGASANNCILNCVASIFGCDIYTVQRPDSASLGAALRAAHGWFCNKKGKFMPISQMYSGMLEKTSLNCNLAVTAGDQEIVSKYTLLMRKRMEIENHLVRKLGRG